jgi:hypothetical protein
MGPRFRGDDEKIRRFDLIESRSDNDTERPGKARTPTSDPIGRGG